MAKIVKQAMDIELTSLNSFIPANALQKSVNLEQFEPHISQEELESLLKKTQDDAFALGKEQGLTEAADHVQPLKTQLETSLSALPQALEEHRLALQHEIADIVLHVVQQFFIEKESNPQIIEQQINQILHQLNHKHSVELHLHPKEIELLNQGAIKLQAHHLNGLHIKAQDNLALGGYVIKTAHGLFDASIEKQIDNLKELLLQLRSRGQHATLD